MSAPTCPSCADFEVQFERIDGPIIAAQVRTGRFVGPDHFKVWRFCPWCGSALVKAEK